MIYIEIFANSALVWIWLSFYCSIVWKTMENNRKTKKTIEIVKKIPCSHFTAISSICHLYSVLTVKSFCEHCPSKNGHSFKSWNDTAMKFGRNASNMWTWKVKTFSSGRYWLFPNRGYIVPPLQYYLGLRREGTSRVILACLTHMKILFIADQRLFTEWRYLARWKSNWALKLGC